MSELFAFWYTMEHRNLHHKICSKLTIKAAVDLDEAKRTLDEGTSGYHRHVFVDVVNSHCQPLFLGHFGLEPRRGNLTHSGFHNFAENDYR